MTYSELIASARENAGANYSRQSLVDLAQAMINDPACVIPVYTKKGEGYVKTEMQPGKAVRENLIAPFLKAFGVDKAELGKLPDVMCTRAGAESLVDFAMLLTKAYISPTGMNRKLTLPMTALDETTATISMVHADKEIRDASKIVNNGDGTFTPTPTGMRTETAERQKTTVKNRVPAWLKKRYPSPDATMAKAA